MADNHYDNNEDEFTYKSYANADYEKFLLVWKICRDCIEGGSFGVKNAANETTIPVEGQSASQRYFNPYLPPNQWQSDPLNYRDYSAYLYRSEFYSYPGDTLIAQLGLLSQGEASITLPPQVEFMLENCTDYNDGLQSLQRRINRQQLTYGRYHLLLEPTQDDKVPLKIREIPAHKFLKGAIDKKWALFDVSTKVFNMENKLDEQVNQLLVLGLDSEGRYYQQIIKPEDWAAFDILNPSSPVYPMLFDKVLNEIPLTCCNISDTQWNAYEMPPLYDLCDMSLNLFRLSADYNQALYMSGQETACFVGVDDKNMKSVRVGAGAKIGLPANSTAFFLSPTGVGLNSQKSKFDSFHVQCQAKGISLIDFKGNSSGTALQTIQGAQTASLHVINNTSGLAIMEQLNFAAEWIGIEIADNKTLVYVPSQAFAETRIVAQEILQLWQAKMQGLKLADSSIHKILKENGYTDKLYDEELAEIESEPSTTAPGGLFNSQMQG